jgi:hypothetical protein
MLRTSVAARGIAPNEEARHGGVFKPLSTASVVALAVVLDTSVQISSAHAQFVCDSEAAGESGQGATAKFNGDVACGDFAKAIGDGLGNGATAIGSFAKATGGGGRLHLGTKVPRRPLAPLRWAAMIRPSALRKQLARAPQRLARALSRMTLARPHSATAP